MSSFPCQPHGNVGTDTMRFQWNFHWHVPLTLPCDLHPQPPWWNQLLSVLFLPVVHLLCSRTLHWVVMYLLICRSLQAVSSLSTRACSPSPRPISVSPASTLPSAGQAHTAHGSVCILYLLLYLTCSWGRTTTVLKSGHLSTRAFSLNGFPWFMWKTVP